MYIKSSSFKPIALLLVLCFSGSMLLPTFAPQQEAEAAFGGSLLYLIDIIVAKKWPDKIECIKCEEEMEAKGDHFEKKCIECHEHYWTCKKTDNLSEGDRAKDHKEVQCEICTKRYYKCAETGNGELVGDVLHGEEKCQPPNDAGCNDGGCYDDGYYDGGCYDDGYYDGGCYDDGYYDGGCYDDGYYDGGCYDDGYYDGS